MALMIPLCLMYGIAMEFCKASGNLGGWSICSALLCIDDELWNNVVR